MTDHRGIEHRRPIDPRGPQFNAILTSVVLALALLTAPGTVGRRAARPSRRRCSRSAVVLGVQRTPRATCSGGSCGRVSPRRRTSRTRTPPRFAQGVGLAFALVGLAGYLAGAPLLGAVATGFALAAALLNAVFGFCLGCEMYLLIRRVAPAAAPAHTTAHTERLGRNTKEEEARHEPRNRTGHRRVGRGASRRPQHRAGRGRRGHHVLRQGPHPGRHQARLDHRPAGPGPP